MYKIKDIKYDEKGVVVGYKLNNGLQVDRETGVMLTRQGKVSNAITGVDETGRIKLYLLEK